MATPRNRPTTTATCQNPNCAKDFEVDRARVDRARRYGSKIYCSSACSHEMARAFSHIKYALPPKRQS